MDLLFSGLDTVRAEDKTVCFVHPTIPEQYAKKSQDMPEKFQKIHDEWAKFNQPVARFKNDIKVGRKRTYNLSIWLGSEKPTKDILHACELEWEEERENGGSVKFSYKQMQSLQTSRNLMLIGVPTDLDAEALQARLQTKMEEARLKMVDQVRLDSQGAKFRPGGLYQKYPVHREIRGRRYPVLGKNALPPRIRINR
jgi:hypothetical protein